MQWVCQLGNGKMLAEADGMYRIITTGYPYPDTAKSNIEALQDLFGVSREIIDDIDINPKAYIQRILDTFGAKEAISRAELCTTKVKAYLCKAQNDWVYLHVDKLGYPLCSLLHTGCIGEAPDRSTIGLLIHTDNPALEYFDIQRGDDIRGVMFTAPIYDSDILWMRHNTRINEMKEAVIAYKFDYYMRNMYGFKGYESCGINWLNILSSAVRGRLLHEMYLVPRVASMLKSDVSRILTSEVLKDITKLHGVIRKGDSIFEYRQPFLRCLYCDDFVDTIINRTLFTQVACLSISKDCITFDLRRLCSWKYTDMVSDYLQYADTKVLYGGNHMDMLRAGFEKFKGYLSLDYEAVVARETLIHPDLSGFFSNHYIENIMCNRNIKSTYISDIVNFLALTVSDSIKNSEISIEHGVFRCKMYPFKFFKGIMKSCDIGKLIEDNLEDFIKVAVLLSIDNFVYFPAKLDASTLAPLYFDEDCWGITYDLCDEDTSIVVTYSKV